MFNNTKNISSTQLHSLNKEIIFLSLPSILANITIPLVGLVDTAIVGHLSNAVAIGGIAIGTMLFDLLYWNFAFLREGTGGLTAQAYGRKDKQSQINLLTQGLIIAIIGAGLIWMIQWIYIKVVLAVVPCSQEVSDFAQQYFYIRIWAAPATLCGMTIRGWFIGMQDTVAAMACDLTVNITNIIVSYMLAYHTSAGVMGVAWGTLIAQYLGFIVGLSIITFKYNELIKLMQIKNACRWHNMKHIFSLNGNLLLRSICMLIIYVGFTSIAAGYGDKELAISTIMMKMFMLFSYFIDGFAYAGEAITGRCFGAKQWQELNLSIRLLFVWTIGIGLLVTIIYAIAGTGVIAILTSDTEVISGSQQYIIWLILMPLISCAAFMWDGIYIGATAGKAIRNSMIYAALSFLFTYFVL